MWNVQAIRLMDWAVEENNRGRAQKMVKIAEKMENAYYKERSLPLDPVKDICEAYRWECKIRKLRPPKQ